VPGIGEVRVHDPNASFEAMATQIFSSRSVSTWEQQFGAAAVEFHVAELVDAEQVDSAVVGDDASQLPVVGGLEQCVHEFRGSGQWGPPR
jgi:hypothetical protein